jgi:hypothetical protein
MSAHIAPLNDNAISHLPDPSRDAAAAFCCLFIQADFIFHLGFRVSSQREVRKLYFYLKILSFGA